MWKSIFFSMVKFKVADSPLYKYGLAILVTLIALQLSWILRSALIDAPFLFFMGAVVFNAWLGGLGPGMLTAALTIVLVDFFLIEPLYEVFTSIGDILEFFIFSLIAFLIGWLEESRNRSEAELREVRDELAVILNTVVDGITAQDKTGNVIFANSAAAELTGYATPEMMIKTPVTDVQRKYSMFDVNSEPLNYDTMPRHHVFRNGEAESLTFKMKFNDTGEERWIYLTSAPVFDDHGKVKFAVNIFRDITERIAVEQDLSRYATLIRNSSDAIISKSLDRIIVSWNPGAEHLYGYTAEEAIGKHISLIFPEHLKEREQQVHQRIRRGEKIEHYETQRLHKNGYTVDISLTISPIRTATGILVGYSTIERNITETKQLTTQLEQEKRKLTTILNTIPGIVYEGAGERDADTQTMEFISQYAEKMLGYSIEEWNESPNFWKQVVHPEDYEEATALANETYAKGIPGPVPFRCITKSGEILYVEAYNATFTDVAGNHMGTCGLVMDVTERKKREQEIMRLTSLIESQRQRLNAIISNMPGVIFDVEFDMKNDKQIVNFVSSYLETMLGYSPEKWKNDPNFWEGVVDPEDYKTSLEEVTAAYEEDRPGRAEFRCTTADGKTVYAESFFNFVQSGVMVRQYGVIMDITQRKANMLAIQDYTEELRRSNEELEQFAYVASHDLQEPLRMVTSYLQLIEQRYSEKLDEDAHEFIGFAVDGASRMKTLINDLLAYSRVQRSSAEFTKVDLQAVLDKVLYNLQISIDDAKAEITCDQLPEITGNEGQMVQLFQNLIGNALKFQADDPPKIHVGASRKGKFWQFCVSDNGIGIDEEYQDRIFVIFQRLHTRQEYSGTGIGLAICRKIVDKHNGKIWLKSVPGDGSTFYFTVPVKHRERLKNYASY